jgi:23S rRNA pseudouridine2605 synthase
VYNSAMAEQTHPKLHAFLAQAGVASRRKSEELILAGKVRVNGSIVKNVADRIDPTKDRVEVDGKRIQPPTAFVYYILNKPVGYVSTVSDPDGKPTVMRLLPYTTRIYPVGRLDLESEGLMLFTNNGELAQRLTHPKFEVNKTYHVLLQGAPSNTALNALQRGVRLKEGMTRPAQVEPFKHERGNTWITITIHQGMQRQVRRMCANVGLQVLRLVRVALGPLVLGDLPVGKWRQLSTEEERALRQS